MCNPFSELLRVPTMKSHSSAGANTKTVEPVTVKPKRFLGETDTLRNSKSLKLEDYSRGPGHDQACSSGVKATAHATKTSLQRPVVRKVGMVLWINTVLLTWNVCQSARGLVSNVAYKKTCPTSAPSSLAANAEVASSFWFCVV